MTHEKRVYEWDIEPWESGRRRAIQLRTQGFFAEAGPGVEILIVPHLMARIEVRQASQCISCEAWFKQPLDDDRCDLCSKRQLLFERSMRSGVEAEEDQDRGEDDD